jgi:hypothetical protein
MLSHLQMGGLSFDGIGLFEEYGSRVARMLTSQNRDMGHPSRSGRDDNEAGNSRDGR